MSEAISRTGRTSGEVYDLAGALHRIVLDGAETGGAAAVVEVTVLPGAGTPPHSDAREDLVWHVIDGRLEFATPGGPAQVEAGESLFFPRGAVHGFMNRGESASTVLMVAHPAGIEAFIREAASMLPSGVPAGPPPAEGAAAFAELAARHGITMHQPEGGA